MALSLDELLKLDYEAVQSTIARLDEHLFKIKNWAIITCGGLLAYGFKQRSVAILFGSMLGAALFDVFAHIYKTFQVSVMDHGYDIEALLQGNDEDLYEPNYRFGVGHAIRGLTLGSLWDTMRLNAVWHLHLFFVLISFFALAAITSIVLGRNSMPSPSMGEGESLMRAEDWIQFGILLIALVTLLVQQWWLIREVRQKERRIETKLDIFKLLSGTGVPDNQGRMDYEGLNEEAISKQLSRPPSEVRKSLYEMLAEETIRYKTNGHYRPRLRFDRFEQFKEGRT